MDPISQLEERVAALLDRLERERADGERLRARVAELEPAARDFKGLHDQNKKLLTQVGKLDDEIKALNEKEGQVRDRLQGILKKIDAMEEALSGQAAE